MYVMKLKGRNFALLQLNLKQIQIDVNRIAIIGSPGSGKSTLAVKLSEKLHIPVVHLDQLFWSPNWEPVDRPVFIAKISNAIQEKQWIIDGHYSRL
jgi:adenylate kinase family enzyme